MAELGYVISVARKKVTPGRSEEDKLDRTVKKVTSLLEAAFSNAEAFVRPVIGLGGSYAKGTWLRGEADVDYFLQYPTDYPREKLEAEALQVAMKAVDGYRINIRFAEHPYVEAFVDGTRVNLVPCYRVQKGEWQSAADRSPYHEEYIRSHFDDKLRLEARLLKKFVKCGDIYGAEVKTQGLSGYVCEVLALKFNSFESVVQAVSALNPSDVISIEPYDKDLASSFTSPLIILDPIDTTRNLGQAISVQSASRFMLRCRRFLSKPSLSYFSNKIVRRVLSKQKLDLLSRTVVVSFHTDPRSVDILWGQLYKSLNSLSAKLRDRGFEVFRATAASDEQGESAFLFLFSEKLLSGYYRRAGPEAFRAEEVRRFVARNKNRSLMTWVDEQGRVSALFARDPSSIDAKNAISELLSKNRIGSAGLSKEIRREIGHEFAIRDGAMTLKNKRGKQDWLKDGVLSILSEEPELAG